ncbi:hypothetical protein E6W39_29215 [Kitasatospora acidiphila]|uniref:Uncharacterized protein n=1 Tax=Kitasatospora acidiphila TaxID=2567942 RepID=A0A540W973_9ACTN|nr:hypothetical protein [Kitasatospora acidiphila]TQF05565.1 hypothetical protein E6W39_29215 [Kitasatospora acidiphila]
MSSMIEPPPTAVAKDAHWARKMARLRARRLPERTASFCDDQSAKDAVNRASIGLATARAAARTAADTEGVPPEQREQWAEQHPLVTAAKEALDRAERELDCATVELTFRGLPRPVWEQLLAEHPPTQEQADKGQEYNVHSFPAALVAACHVERDTDGAEVDGLSVAEAQELLDTWSDADARALFTAALLVNQTVRADLGKG